MKKLFSLAALVAVGLSVAACSSDMSAKFQAGISNLTSNIKAVNQAIGDVSPSLLQNCNMVQGVALSLQAIAAGTKYQPDIDAAAAVINTDCQAAPAQNVKDVIDITAKAYVNAKAAYDAAQAGK